MLRAKNPVKSRDQLSEIVQGRPQQPFGRSVDVHISNLRKKIAATCDGQLEIEAVRGQGYRIRVTK
jgi:DNA-binding response OmpR family regulator